MDLLDIQFNETDTTQDRLIKATQMLIACYGYEGTSTRMIANVAGVNLSAINFHFGNKENLTKAAMVRIAEGLDKAFAPLANEIEEYLAHPPYDKEKLWEYTDRLLTDRIGRVFRARESWVNINIEVHENELPDSSRGIVANTAIEKSEAVLGKLILALMDRPNPTKAMFLARMAYADIMALKEKPWFIELLEDKFSVEPTDDEAEQFLHDYLMESIRSNISVGIDKRY